jgi:hypothetical protein
MGRMPGSINRPAGALTSLLNEGSISSELKVRNARIVVIPRSRRVRSIRGALVEPSGPIVSRSGSVVPVECSRSPHISRIGLRCSDNRTKRNSCGRGKDQDFSHDLAPFGVSLQPRSSWNHTCTREPGFASANYECLIPPYGWAKRSHAAARPSQTNENGPLSAKRRTKV